MSILKCTRWPFEIIGLQETALCPPVPVPPPRPPPQFFFYYFLTCLKEKTALTEPTNRIQYQYVIIAALYMIVFEVYIFETNLAE